MQAKIPRARNQLYVIDANITQIVCFLARGEEDTWQWHARLGHLNLGGGDVWQWHAHLGHLNF
jgi:hypothetical protein